MIDIQYFIAFLQMEVYLGFTGLCRIFAPVNITLKKNKYANCNRNLHKV